jgi:hypothetical protein
MKFDDTSVNHWVPISTEVVTAMAVVQHEVGGKLLGDQASEVQLHLGGD